MLEGDAQVHDFAPRSFDAVISRFGCMFFDDPQAAFANLARALRPGGRLVLVCWQEPLKSEWIAVALGAVATVLKRRPDLGPPGFPGPFSLADADRLSGLLTSAELHGAALRTLTRPVLIGRSIEDAVAFIMSLPQSRQLFTGAPDHAVEAAGGALRAALAPHAGSSGVVMKCNGMVGNSARLI